MTLLLSRCESTVLHALGATSLPPEVSVLELVDRAGRWLCSHPWTWLNRTGSVNTVAGTNYVNLTTGLPDLRAIYAAQVAQGWLVPTSLDDIILRRAVTVPNMYPAIYALSTSLDTTTDSGYVTRMELFPTPSSVAAIQIFYRAGWAAPFNNSDASRIRVPEDWEGVFLEALVAYAMGVQERDVAGVAERLELIARGTQYQNLIRQDGMAQSNFGTLRGGGVELQTAYIPTLRTSLVPAP